MTLKYSFRAIALSALVFASSAMLPAYAEFKPARIAVVDIQHVVKNSSAAQDAANQVKTQQAAYEADIKKKEAALKDEEKKVIGQRNLLAADAFQKKHEEFKKSVVAFQRDVQQKREALAQARAVALGEIHKAVLQIVDELAKEKGFDLAVPSAELLYASNDLNISPDVLERLNKKLPKISLKIGAKK